MEDPNSPNNANNNKQSCNKNTNEDRILTGNEAYYSNEEEAYFFNKNEKNLSHKQYESKENIGYVDKEPILFPGYVPIAFKYLSHTTQPRHFCLRLITSPWFERISMFIILINCITLGMYQPCEDNPCVSTKCIILKYVDHAIYVFFVLEMSIKILAMGFWGKDTYMAETWNRLDFFIVLAG